MGRWVGRVPQLGASAGWRLMTMERLWWIDESVSLGARCPLCANDAGNRLFLRVGAEAQAVRRSAVVDVARCGQCGSAWFPTLDIGDSYPVADGSRLSADFWVLIDHYVELVGGLDWKVAFAERLPHTDVGRVLEVGCNTGLLLDYVHRVWGADVVGLEPSVYGQAGAQRFGLTIEPCYTSDLLAAGTEPFDLVLSTEVIEHVTDPAQFMRELRALVRPGGVAFVTTPNADGLSTDRTPGELYAMLSVGSHRMILSARQLTTLAHQAGFASVQIAAEPVTLIAVLADEAIELSATADPRPHLLGYHTARLHDRERVDEPTRWRLADLVARYVLARELATVDSLEGEAQIDECLGAEFDVDVHDLASLIDRVEQATTIFEFGRIAPFSTPAYLFHRGHRDDISESERTEMWEAAVVMIARGMAIDPVNLFMLERTLDVTLAALAGRTSRRWNVTARAALAEAPELRERELPYVREPAYKRLLRSARHFVPARHT
jgi:SAM-dependent methyltransferase